MTQKEFLETLRKDLADLPPRQVDDILSDYQQHFELALNEGRTEEQIASELGSPASLARSHRAEEKIQEFERAQSTFQKGGSLLGAIKALVILTPLNLILVLGPFSILMLIGFVSWVVVGALFFASFAGLAEWFFMQSRMELSWRENLSVLFLICGFIGLTTLGLFVLAFLSQAALRIMYAYCRWNLNFITQGGQLHARSQ